jgi:outer membrane receptor for ferrienterochelin and colicin
VSQRRAGVRTPGGWMFVAVHLSVLSTAALAQDPPRDAEMQLVSLSLEDLMEIEVVTASRTEEKLPRSTSVMNVITARDIQRSGLRTIYEVLTRVPGFFPSAQATWKHAWPDVRRQRSHPPSD